MSLHDKILNIPCEVDKAKKAINRIEYKNGHRDARHMAAELAIEYDNNVQYLEDHRQITESAIGLAKVHLINNEPSKALEILHHYCEKLDELRKV